MDHSTEIRLGLLAEEELQAPDEKPGAVTRSPGLRVATGLSLVLHGVLVLFLFWTKPERETGPEVSRLDTVSITLVSRPDSSAPTSMPGDDMPRQPMDRAASPLDGNAVDETSMELAVESAAQVATDAESLRAPADTTVGQPAVNLAVVPDLPESASRDSSAQSPRPDSTSTLAIRQAVREREVRRDDSNASRTWVCTAAQLRSPLLDCPQEPETDYVVLLEATIYRAFNPGVEVSRARRTIGLIAENQERLGPALSALNVDGIDGATMADAMAAAIDTYTGSGNTPLLRLEQQIYRNDAAYQQMQRTLNPR